MNKYSLRFFAPDDGGASTSGGASNAGSQQDQNQNQLPNLPEDPFSGLDLDLMDDATRTQIQTARDQYKQSRNLAVQTSTIQSQLDRTKAELQRLQTGNQQQQQQSTGQAQTLADELTQFYKDEGFDAQTIPKLVKLREKEFKAFAPRFAQDIGQGLSPIVGNVVDRSAQEAFEQITTNDDLGLDDKSKEELWQKIEGMKANGQPVNKDIANNLASIIYVRQIREGRGIGSNAMNQNQLSVPPQSQNANGNMTTRFTYPGAGIHARPNVMGQSKGEFMDADTQAAVNATMESWPKELQAKLRAKRGGR